MEDQPPLARLKNELVEHLFGHRDGVGPYRRGDRHNRVGELRRPAGFAVPIPRWLRYDLRSFLSDHLQSSRVAQKGLLRQTAIDRLVVGQVSGEADYAHQLWVLLMLDLWYRMVLRP